MGINELEKNNLSGLINYAKNNDSLWNRLDSHRYFVYHILKIIAKTLADKGIRSDFYINSNINWYQNFVFNSNLPVTINGTKNQEIINSLVSEMVTKDIALQSGKQV